MPWDRNKPWTAPARSVDLYRSRGRWKFGLAVEGGILDGVVQGVTADDDPQVASAGFLLTLTESTGVAYAAKWTERPTGRGTENSSRPNGLVLMLDRTDTVFSIALARSA